MKTNEAIDQINSIFKSHFKYGEIDRVQMQNLLNYFADYILAKNEININNYTINFHFVPESELDELFVYAYMQYTKSDLSEYSICLPKSFRSCSYNHSNRDLVFFMISVCHELQHVVQYIKHPELMDKKFDYIDLFYDEEENLNTFNTNPRLVKKLHKKTSGHLSNINVLTTTEKNAERFATRNLMNIYRMLLEKTEDELYKQYLLENKSILKNFQKDREKYYYIINKNEKQLTKSLIKDFGLKKEDLLIP